MSINELLNLKVGDVVRLDATGDLGVVTSLCGKPLSRTIWFLRIKLENGVSGSVDFKSISVVQKTYDKREFNLKYLKQKL